MYLWYDECVLGLNYEKDVVNNEKKCFCNLNEDDDWDYKDLWLYDIELWIIYIIWFGDYKLFLIDYINQ
jgi:hypothetical protein